MIMDINNENTRRLLSASTDSETKKESQIKTTLRDNGFNQENNNSKEANYTNITKVLYQSLVQLILLSAFSCTSYLVSQIYSQLGYSNFGQICLFTNYAAFFIMTLFVPTIRTKLTFRMSFLLATSGILCFIIGGLLLAGCSCNRIPFSSFLCQNWVIYISNIIFSMCSGCASTLLYATGGEYVGCASSHDNKGLFYGISWAIAQSSIAIGNFSAGLFIRNLGQFEFYVIMTIAAIISFGLFFFLEEVPKDTPREPVSLKSEVKGFCTFFSQTRIRPLFSLMFLSGLNIAFYSGFIYILIQNSLSGDANDVINEKTSFVLGIQGIFEFATGLIFGRLADKYDKKYLVYIANTLLILYILLSIALNFTLTYTIAYFIAIVLGMGDCFTAMLISCYLSTDFSNKVEGFSTFNMIQSAGCVFGVLLSIIIGDQHPIVYLSVYLGYSLLMYMTIGKYDFKEKEGKEASV